MAVSDWRSNKCVWTVSVVFLRWAKCVVYVVFCVWGGGATTRFHHYLCRDGSHFWAWGRHINQHLFRPQAYSDTVNSRHDILQQMGMQVVPVSRGHYFYVCSRSAYSLFYSPLCPLLPAYSSRATCPPPLRLSLSYSLVTPYVCLLARYCYCCYHSLLPLLLLLLLVLRVPRVLLQH